MFCPSSEFSENSESIGAYLSYNDTLEIMVDRRPAQAPNPTNPSPASVGFAAGLHVHWLVPLPVPPAKMRGIQQQ